jgi:hypothetical protein
MLSSRLAGVMVCQTEVVGQLTLEVAQGPVGEAGGAGGGEVDRWHLSSFWTGFVTSRSRVIRYVKCHFRLLLSFYLPRGRAHRLGDACELFFAVVALIGTFGPALQFGLREEKGEEKEVSARVGQSAYVAEE